MARTPSEYSVHLLLDGGHREEIRFATLQDFQLWYSKTLVPKQDSSEFLNVPIKNIQGEYMVIRPPLFSEFALNRYLVLASIAMMNDRSGKLSIE